jgi:hypothetical protein
MDFAARNLVPRGIVDRVVVPIWVQIPALAAQIEHGFGLAVSDVKCKTVEILNLGRARGFAAAVVLPQVLVLPESFGQREVISCVR